MFTSGIFLIVETESVIDGRIDEKLQLWQLFLCFTRIPVANLQLTRLILLLSDVSIDLRDCLVNIQLFEELGCGVRLLAVAIQLLGSSVLVDLTMNR